MLACTRTSCGQMGLAGGWRRSMMVAVRVLIRAVAEWERESARRQMDNSENFSRHSYSISGQNKAVVISNCCSLADNWT